MFFALSLLVGCGAPADPTGIWMFTFPYTDAGTECADTLTENFSVGEPPEDDTTGDTTSPWTYTEDATGSDSFLFAQMTTTTPDNGLLVVGGVAFPGTRTKDTWTFQWADASTSSAGMDHDSGYGYSESASTSDSSTITITLAGAEGTGSTASSYITESAWTESDEWSREAAEDIGGEGQIPSASYLVDEARGTSVVNEFDRPDCDSMNCTLTLTTTCSGSGSFTATRTDLADEDAYDYMQSAGQ